jgi:hypothetical protein
MPLPAFHPAKAKMVGLEPKEALQNRAAITLFVDFHAELTREGA